MSRLSDTISHLVDNFGFDPGMKLTGSDTSDDIDDRVETMMDMIDEATEDIKFTQLTAKILENVPSHDNEAEIQAMFEFVRQQVRYTRDPYNKERFQKPVRSVELGIGDCDDQVMVLATLLLVIGYPVILRVVAVSSDQFEHIYCLAGTPPGAPTKWIPLDPSRTEPFGWEVPKSAVKKSLDYIIDFED